MNLKQAAMCPYPRIAALVMRLPQDTKSASTADPSRPTPRAWGRQFFVLNSSGPHPSASPTLRRTRCLCDPRSRMPWPCLQLADAVDPSRLPRDDFRVQIPPSANQVSDNFIHLNFPPLPCFSVLVSLPCFQPSHPSYEVSTYCHRGLV